MEYFCFICKEIFTKISDLLFHLIYLHTKVTEFKCCLNPNCTSTYSSLDALRKHLKQEKCLINSALQINESIPIENDPIDSGTDLIPNQTNNNITETETVCSRDNDEFNLKQFQSILESFVFKLNSTGLPNTTIDLIIEFARDLSSDTVKLCIKYLNNRKMLLQNASDASELLHFLESSFENCTTVYKRRKLFDTKSIYIKPIELATYIRYNNRFQSDSNIPIIKPVQSTFIYIPIIDSLNSILQNPEVFDFLTKKPNTNNNIIADYTDGSNYKNSTAFSENDLNIFIQIFYDDFEVVNPLGSKTGVHKIGAIYFSIRNFPPYLLGKLNNIFLLSLFYQIDIKNNELSYNDILKPIVRDIGILEKGIDINNRTIKGSLVSICYDNLGANYLLGFSKSFSASFFFVDFVYARKKSFKVLSQKRMLKCVT